MTISIYYGVKNNEIVELEQKPASAVTTLKKIAKLMQSSAVGDAVKQKGIEAAIAVRDGYAKKVAGLSWFSRWLFSDIDTVNIYCLQSIFGQSQISSCNYDQLAEIGLNSLEQELPRNDPHLRCTWLFMAVTASAFPLATYLIENGSDINCGRSAGRFFGYDWEASSPLMWAITRYNLDMVKFLLKKGAATDCATDSENFDAAGSNFLILLTLTALIQKMKEANEKNSDAKLKTERLEILKNIEVELEKYPHQTFQPDKPRTQISSSSQSLHRVPSNGFGGINDSVL